jgi:hypothetical protein
LAQRREIASYVGAQTPRPSVAAETIGHILLHFELALIALSLIVVEGDGEVVEESQHLCTLLWLGPSGS